MPSRRWWPPICSICATAALSIAANISGKICSISSPTEFFSSLLKQIYLDQQYIPEPHPRAGGLRGSRGAGRTAQRKKRPQSGDPDAAARAEEGAAGSGGNQRQTRLPTAFPHHAPVVEGRCRKRCRTPLGLPEPPKRIECFDISHIQGTDKVASMVVWEDGRMKKSDYRKFIIRTVVGNDDFASMREVVTRRYSRLQQENKPFPSLILIDGGLGQLHAAVEALEAIGVINQPVASIAKREEIIYVYGQEDDPIKLDRYSPVLHLIQQVRDEAHRFAVTFHRTAAAPRV